MELAIPTCQGSPGLTAGEIARRLDVAHVVEGSVRKAGDRVRITVRAGFEGRSPIVVTPGQRGKRGAISTRRPRAP